MQKLLKNLFTNNILFAVSTGYAVVYCLISTLITQSTSLAVLCLLIALCNFFLFYSYRHHDKNLMKGLVGAQLAFICIIFVEGIDRYDDTLNTVFVYMTVCLILFLVINHFIINSSRFSSPNNVFLNQVVSLVLCLVCMVWNLIPSGEGILYTVYYLAGAVNNFAQIFVIVYIESKLDVYRTKREANGWTLEKGYAEDYDRTGRYGK